MKSFKAIMSEVAQPKSPEEKKFKDMHSYETKSHPVAPDAVFTGAIGADDLPREKAKRKADQDGDANYDKQFKEAVDTLTREELELEINEDLKAVSRQPHPKGGHIVTLQDKNGKKVVRHLNKGKVTDMKSEETTPVVKPKPTSIKSITTTKRNPFKGKLKPAANRRPGYVAGDDEIGESNNLVDEAFGDKIKSALSFPKRQVSAAHLDNAIKQHDEKRISHEMKASEAKIIGKSGLSDKQKASYDDSKEMHHRAGEKHHTIAKNHLRAAQTANNKNKMDQVHKHMTDYHKHQDHKTYGKEVHVSKLHKMGTRNEAVNEQVRESFTEMLDEAVKMGNLRLKDGKSVKVSAQDAKLLNQFYKDLNAKNRRDMEKVMMKDTSGFKEIVGFAREAL
jgi:hypothetical protein